MPISLPAQPPSRKKATTPYAAATDSRFITAAVTAMTTLRNATSSRSIDTTTTPPMSSASRSAIDALRSIVAAVAPPTWTCRAGALGRGRDHVVAQRRDEVLGGGLLRSGGGHDGDQRRVAGRD